MFELVIVIPVYQHGEALKITVQRLARYELPIIIVNDGSDPAHSQLIGSICQAEHITLLERSENGGKGAAVIDGLRESERRGYSQAFQIDADGQHDISRLPEFIRSTRESPDAMVLGYACYDRSVPFGRKLGRYLTHVWVWINSMSFNVRDSMCGFRIYPVASILKIIDGAKIGRRMDFDVELCVRACWAGIKIINLPVEVVYPRDGKSNFRIREDNILISLMHARLFFGMLLHFSHRLLTRLRSTWFSSNGLGK